MFDQIASPSAPSGAMSPVETSSGTLIRIRPSICWASGNGSGGGTMLRPFSSSIPAPSGRWGDDLAVVHVRVRRGWRELRHLAQLARIGDLAAQRRRCGGCGRAEVDLVARRAAAAGEVPVERPHRDGAGRRRLADADARPAGRFEDARAGSEQVAVHAAAHDHVEDLPRAGRHRQVELGGQRAPTENGRDEGEVLVRGVHGAADADLRASPCPPPPAPARRSPATTAARSAARARRDRSPPPRRTRRRRRRRARRSGPRAPARRARSASARRSGRSRWSRRSPSPCCRSSRGRSRSASRRPSPWNSKIRPRPPRTPRRRRSSSTTSLDCTHGRSRPRSSTPTTSGRSTGYGRPAIATATSVAPAPIASIPSAPAIVVWLSAPSSTWPGREKRSRCR